MKNLIISFILFGLLIVTANAQSAFPAFGGDISGTGGSVSFSAGLVAFTAHSDVGGSVSQGVQHPFEILVVSSVELAEDISLSFSAYPNPATNILYLKINNYNTLNLWYQLYDANGSMFEKAKIVENITPVMVDKLVPSTYFLKIIDNSREIKTYKFIKK